jgi:hypothetical protein
VRLWGVWGRFAEPHLPLVVRIRIGEDAGDSIVNVVADSDEGWYLVYTTQVTAAYERRFAFLIERIGSIGRLVQ